MDSVLLQISKHCVELNEARVVVLVKALETGTILLIVDVKKSFICFEERFLIKQHFKFVKRFSELSKYLSDVPNSKTFIYFTKITAATWFTNKIIPISIALISVISP
jgi:hypothetical protein